MSYTQIEANGLRFECLDSGDGPLVLLLHGFPDTPHGFTATIQALAAAGFRAVAPYQRGYAPSDVALQSDTTLKDLGLDALALIRALGYESAIVVGHDWGAGGAYYAAAADPERVSRLVAIGLPHPATLKPSPRVLWVGRHFIYLRWPTATAWMRRRGFAHVDRLYRRWSPTWRFTPEDTEPVKRCFADPASLNAAVGYYRAVRPGYVPEALRRQIQVDTLVFAGEDDPALGRADYEGARRKFAADYEVVMLPGGHFVHRESPDAFLERLLSFVQSEPQTAITSAKGG